MRYLIAAVVILAVLMPSAVLAGTGAGASIAIETTVVSSEGSVPVITTVVGSSGGYYWDSGSSKTSLSPPAVIPPNESVVSPPPAEPYQPVPMPPGQPPIVSPPLVWAELSGGDNVFTLVIVIGVLLAIYGLIKWRNRRA